MDQIERIGMTEYPRRMERPVRVVHELPCDGDQVGLAVAQDRFRMPGLGDHAYGHGRDAGILLHLPRVADLIAGYAWNAGHRTVPAHAARRAVDHIDAALLQRTRERNRVLDAPFAAAT